MNIPELDKTRIPQHVAVIMDGNGRWAKQRKHERLFGHKNAITAVRQTIETAGEIGVKYLTLYAFSTENWNRRKEEVDGLMVLLAKTIADEIDELQRNNVRLCMIGDIDRLPDFAAKSLKDCINQTASNSGLTLVLALSYSSRWELARAMRQIASEAKAGTLDVDAITEETIAQHLATAQYPDPDLLIRTGGEQRLSNFMLWQMSYAEFYFTDLLWPDFRREHFIEAIADYQSRQRRYGRSGDQLEQSAPSK